MIARLRDWLARRALRRLAARQQQTWALVDAWASGPDSVRDVIGGAR